MTRALVEIETGIEVGPLLRDLRFSMRFYRELGLQGRDAVSLGDCRRFGGFSHFMFKDTEGSGQIAGHCDVMCELRMEM